MNGTDFISDQFTSKFSKDFPFKVYLTIKCTNLMCIPP